MKWLCALAGVVLAALGQGAAAQGYPTRPITVIVPFSAGGPTDVLARLVSDHMSRTLTQPISVENVVGAGGTTGSIRAFRAAPDGYTLITGNMGSHAAARIYKQIPYDPTQFEPVGMIAFTPMYVAVRKEFPARNLQEFVDLVKKSPGTVTNGHAGIGSTSHLVCLLLARTAGINTRDVAYPGTGPAVNDLAAGKIDSMCDQAPTIVPQLQSGAVRGLAIVRKERSKATPDVPTAAEAGIADFQATGWNAMFAPRGTPRPVLDKLAAALNSALTDPAIRARIDELGSIAPAPAEATPQWLGEFVRSEMDHWSRVIQAGGVSVP